MGRTARKTGGNMIIRRLVTAVLGLSLVIGLGWVFTETSSAQGEVVILQGTFKKLKLKRKKTYLLRGGVFIKKVLNIQSGTDIFCESGSFLVIDQGARIKAEGTLQDPIVFTSAQPVGQRRRGDWGGLIFNGRAPINVPGGIAEGEGDTGQYGGGTSPNAADDSGLMRFVRVEYGGFAISPDNELNCIAFQGVGSTTDIQFVQAAFGGDDGIEMFGGTVNLRNVIATGASDDSIDWTEGWSGKVQFALVQQRGDEADAGMECDNSAENHNLTPRSAPKIANVTLIGAPDIATGPGSTRGMLLRVGTHGQFRNFIVMGFKNVGLEIRDAATFSGFDGGTLAVHGFIFFNNRSNNPNVAAGATADAIATHGVKIMQSIDPLLADPLDTTSPDFRPQAGSPALDPANVDAQFPNDSFFVAAPFVGAFDANNDWTLGWTKWVFGS
jgi:hypothetical protein